MDGRKRGRPEVGFNSNGGFKKFKPELESFSTGVGSKSKPCTKFFSTAGCPFGEGCHFLHYVPGGYNAVAQTMNLAPIAPPPSRNNVPARPAGPVGNGSSTATVKTRLCNRFNSAEGCKFGDKCHYAHGEWEIGKMIAPSRDDYRSLAPVPGHFGGRAEPPPPPPGPASGFGASTTAKISVDASLAGAIIGKGGINSKHICRQTGAKLSIRENESDPSLRNIELEGTYEQVDEACTMVRELIYNVSVTTPTKPNAAPRGHAPPGSNYKTKLCDNFAKGTCTFGERCHFAHGAAELRKAVI